MVMVVVVAMTVMMMIVRNWQESTSALEKKRQGGDLVQQVICCQNPTKAWNSWAHCAMQVIAKHKYIKVKFGNTLSPKTNTSNSGSDILNGETQIFKVEFQSFPPKLGINWWLSYLSTDRKLIIRRIAQGLPFIISLKYFLGSQTSKT